MQKIFPVYDVWRHTNTSAAPTPTWTQRLSVFPTSSEKSMADALLRVREFDDNVEVPELDYVLRHRGYGYLAHPGVSKEDKLGILNQEDGFCLPPRGPRPPTPARWHLGSVNPGYWDTGLHGTQPLSALPATLGSFDDCPRQVLPAALHFLGWGCWTCHI